MFGALLSPAFLAEVPWTGWLFAILALVIARPVALYVSFLGSKLTAREQAAAMWFGPKGFASVVYGLLVLQYARRLVTGLGGQLALCSLLKGLSNDLPQ